MRCSKVTLFRGPLAVVLMACSLARADVISDWNAIALETVTGSGRYRAYEESRVMAMVNTAMSETIKFNEARGPSSFVVTPPYRIAASSAAAAAAAAHYVLVQFHPERKASLDAALQRSLALEPDEVKRESGRIMGMNLGMNLYAIQASDDNRQAAARKVDPPAGISDERDISLQDAGNEAPYYYSSWE
jgi:hypothetical protein